MSAPRCWKNGGWKVASRAPGASDHDAAAPLGRSEARERALLTVAELQAGESGFVAHAARRLIDRERVSDDQGTVHDLDRMLRELSDASADMGAWAVLALLALEQQPELDGARRQLIATALRAAVLWGACAHRAIEIAGKHVDGQGSGPGARRQ
jgi:hypothetical protein